MAKSKHKSDNTIAVNKKARHDYFIEEKIEVGLVLEGWEVKKLAIKKYTIKRKLCAGQKYGGLVTWRTYQPTTIGFYT